MMPATAIPAQIVFLLKCWLNSNKYNESITKTLSFTYLKKKMPPTLWSAKNILKVKPVTPESLPNEKNSRMTRDEEIFRWSWRFCVDHRYPDEPRVFFTYHTPFKVFKVIKGFPHLSLPFQDNNKRFTYDSLFRTQPAQLPLVIHLECIIFSHLNFIFHIQQSPRIHVIFRVYWFIKSKCPKTRNRGHFYNDC